MFVIAGYTVLTELIVRLYALTFSSFLSNNKYIIYWIAASLKAEPVSFNSSKLHPLTVYRSFPDLRHWDEVRQDNISA